MLSRHPVWILLVLISSLGLTSCGGDGEGSPEPVTGVDISAAQADLEIGNATEITAVVTGGESKALTWTVNGIENGNEVYGTITQNSPVTYNAPDSLPADATIVIGAVSVQDETKSDTCHIHLKFTTIFVDAEAGDDGTGSGSVNLPVKSITRGLAIAEAGMTVLVRPGVYDQANGEVFELELPAGVALVGTDWEECIIRGHAVESFYNGTVIMRGQGTEFRKFTLEMGEPADPRWIIALQVYGDYQLVDSIRVLDGANDSVARVGGADNTVIQNCYFANDDGLYERLGYGVVEANDNLVLRNCTISGYATGIRINGFQSPRIEGCLFSGNAVGAELWYELPDNNPNPDFGGGGRGSIGGNIFTNNTTCGLENPTSNDIYARFNTWDSDPPEDGVDFCNTGAGSVIFQ